MVKGSAYNSGLVANLTYHCTAQNSEGYAEQATVIAVKGTIIRIIIQILRSTYFDYFNLHNYLFNYLERELQYEIVDESFQNFHLCKRLLL